jgi:hypothetical protein
MSTAPYLDHLRISLLSEVQRSLGVLMSWNGIIIFLQSTKRWNLLSRALRAYGVPLLIVLGIQSGSILRTILALDRWCVININVTHRHLLVNLDRLSKINSLSSTIISHRVALIATFLRVISLLLNYKLISTFRLNNLMILPNWIHLIGIIKYPEFFLRLITG